MKGGRNETIHVYKSHAGNKLPAHGKFPELVCLATLQNEDRWTSKNSIPCL